MESIIQAAAAAAARPAETTSVKSVGEACKAFGAYHGTSVDKAYECIRKAGCDTSATPPIHIEADASLAPGDLTVLGARAAIQNNRPSAVAVQRSRKRSSDGSASQLVAWVVL